MNEPQQPEVKVPTKEQLQAQLNGLIIQRSQAKDQIESIERQLPVITGMIQLLNTQAMFAEQEAEKVDTDKPQD